jgi:KDO2-lipid IV(A) lauroyltransferase
MNKTRSRFGTELIKDSQILRRVLKAKSKKEPVAVWLAGDQTPPDFYKFWFTFLNRETSFYPGPAFISKRFNQPVIFMRIDKTGRGKYLTTVEVLFENPAEVSEEKIIKAYIDKMEEIIREKPEYYLWSHRRWKHKRPEGTELIT